MEASRVLGPMSSLHTINRLNRVALSPHKSRNPRAQAQAYLDIGKYYRRTGKGREAVRFLHKSVMLWEALNVESRLAIALHARGLAYLQLGYDVLALKDFEESAALKYKLGLWDELVSTLNVLARFHLKRGHIGAANENCRQATAILDYCTNRVQIAKTKSLTSLVSKKGVMK